MSLPQSNATLLEVESGGGSEDWSTPAGAGATAWAGEEPAYYQEERERVTAGGNSDVVIRRKLIVLTALREWSEGEMVTFDLDGNSRQGQVKMIERSSLAGVGNKATTTLTLEVQ